ncbi:MAG: hypothetical protein IJV22_01525 [Bacteroidales bacterium]|nr:hypothetical protein [Bacteroidales bacterium]
MSWFHRNKSPRPILECIGTDMHCHLVPNVDDGSRGVEETVACLRAMQDAGYKKVYITPHFTFPRYPNDADDIRQRFDALQREVESYDLDIRLAGVAGEYQIGDKFNELVENAKCLKVADKYLLTELSLHQRRMGVEETMFNVMMKGYDPILAHPERYPYYNINSRELSNLKEQGVLFQVNVLSLAGFYGEGAMHRGFEYIEAGWVELLGTDMHNTMYAKALTDACTNKKIEKLLSKHTFMNSTL